MWRVYWILGLLSKRSCYRMDGKPKQRHKTREAAEKAANSLSNKTGRDMEAYRCWFRCRKWHIGGAVNK